ncbi:uncharacterized protein LOC106883812 isoform X2 [Octopus bimaculoides]|uniref:uncharacterized protein LOC106883812 isoform X2 n=1 Tax=Octopus bimaculoides TaxID=37653 RepID=UPI0022E7D756|nr:uncharacterized protein LOC106883812 isoform X2 [Octopus bimaculoides]
MYVYVFICLAFQYGVRVNPVAFVDDKYASSFPKTGITYMISPLKSHLNCISLRCHQESFVRENEFIDKDQKTQQRLSKDEMDSK